jgi:nucleoside phosphorylase
VGAKAVLEHPADLARHIIRFDSADRRTFAAFSLPQAGAMTPSSRSPIPWPAGTAPAPAPLSRKPQPHAPLPRCDHVIVTWTVEEAKCLADTLTPGHASQGDWYDYTHNYQSVFVPLIRKGAPALESTRLASWFPTVIAGKRVLCMKSELHLSQDGPKLPVAMLWRQIIAETGCSLIVTTGTAGGIGAGMELGDVVVAQSVRFDCMAEFKSQPFHNAVYPCSALKTGSFGAAGKLFAANANHLGAEQRLPRIVAGKLPSMPEADVVTTDFFAFDDSSNTFHLQGLGDAVEMGDAVLGMVTAELGTQAPRWIAVRNASDPQIDSAGLTTQEAARKAAQIYERFGYWTTIPSAITCWALVMDN